MGISTHILDLTRGQPAASVKVTLSILDAKGHWADKATAKTDFEGRCRALVPDDQPAPPGTYRLRFDTGAYFAAQNIQPFFPFVEITFTVTNRSAAPVSILRWYTPLEGVRGDIFRVTRGRRELPYEGPMMKRGEPSARDYVEIPAGESVTGTADLSAAYGIREPGTYRVAFTRGLADVVRAGDSSPRLRDAHRPRKLSCGPIAIEVTPG